MSQICSKQSNVESTIKINYLYSTAAKGSHSHFQECPILFEWHVKHVEGGTQNSCNLCDVNYGAMYKMNLSEAFVEAEHCSFTMSGRASGIFSSKATVKKKGRITFKTISKFYDTLRFLQGLKNRKP